MHRGRGRTAVWSATLSLLILLLAPAPEAEAHQRLVGVIQASGGPDGAVTVLLKLEVRALMAELKLGEIADDDPRLLTTDKGRHEVLRLLRRTHELESWKGVCERDEIERFGLTPSGGWLDVQIKYRCPTPAYYVMVRLDTLLDEEGHRIVGHFDAGSGAQKVLYNRRSRRQFLLFEEGGTPAQTPVLTASPPARSADGDRRALLLHPELMLLLLALAAAPGLRRRRSILAGGAAVLGGGAAVAALVLGASAIPGIFGVAGFVIVAGVSARALIMGEETGAQDAVIAAGGALFVGLTAAHDAQWEAWGEPWVGLLVWAAFSAVGLLGLVAEETSARFRRALGFGSLAVAVFLGAGEVFRLMAHW